MGGKIKDLIGNRYGKLVVVSYVITVRKNSYWVCKCDCGNETIIRTASLQSGNSTTCGCSKKVNIAGQVFGKLTAISSFIDEKGNKLWRCSCECGGSRDASAGALRFGSIKSCGCLNNMRDLTGLVFGRLIARVETRNNKNKKVWLCDCSCGGSIEVSSTNLVKGKVSSCGCSRIVGGLEGKIFGKLTAVSYAGLENNKQYWWCDCACGNEAVKIPLSKLTSGKAKSCGCSIVHLSPGERFNKLVTVEPVKIEGSKASRWLCKCACGGIKVVLTESLKAGRTGSCGCYNDSIHTKGYEDIQPSYFKGIRRGAEARNLSFDITIEDMWNQFILQDKRCALSGLPITLSRKTTEKFTASMDRIDSTKGYFIGNIQWVHKSINKMKLNLPEDFFIEMCSAIHNHRGVKEKDISNYE